jgi:YhcH/YjgK/YiaL family protein
VSHSESHRYWQDLVILLQGSEIICSDFLEEYRAAKSYDVEQDIALYQNQAECITTVMRPGMFVLFTPEDVHHPCISNGTVSHVRKITYKIHIQKGDKFDD